MFEFYAVVDVLLLWKMMKLAIHHWTQSSSKNKKGWKPEGKTKSTTRTLPVVPASLPSSPTGLGFTHQFPPCEPGRRDKTHAYVTSSHYVSQRPLLLSFVRNEIQFARQDVRHVNYHQVFQKMQIILQQMVTLNPPPGGCITAGLERLQSPSSVQPI